MSPRDYIASRSVPEPNSGCWLWLGTLNNWGYGRTQVKWTSERAAHRIAWCAYRGPIPAGTLLRHKCDVPSCVNPDHLLTGTHRENMDDMVRRGRYWSRSGAASPAAKLSAAQVADIRARRATGETLRSIAQRHGTHLSNVSLIARGESWRG